MLKPGEITFYNLDGEEIEKEPKKIEWDAEAAEKAGFEHFMMKEIHEQPKAVADTTEFRYQGWTSIDLTRDRVLDDERSGTSARFISWPAALLTMWEWLHSM